METRLRTSRLSTLLEYVLLPPACCLCGLQAQGHGLDLCALCLACLPAASGEACSQRPRHSVFRTFDRVLVPYVYRYPVDEFVRALKFRGERRFGRLLGVLIAAEHVRSRADAPAVLIPLPLHRSRLRRRGFNQAQAIAAHAGAALGVPVESFALTRVRATSEQSRLGPGQRQLNVLGAFAAQRRFEALERVAIVDDVITTGSTAREAALCLRAAGANHVELWAAAQVPHMPGARA
jgi:ComF family protein